jgi:hypothetical protein
MPRWGPGVGPSSYKGLDQPSGALVSALSSPLLVVDRIGASMRMVRAVAPW